MDSDGDVLMESDVEEYPTVPIAQETPAPNVKRNIKLEHDVNAALIALRKPLDARSVPLPSGRPQSAEVTRWLDEILKADYVLVVDTNVFISHQVLLKHLISLCHCRSVRIVIPFVVLQELDNLKMKGRRVNAGRAVESFARDAVHFIADNLRAHPDILFTQSRSATKAVQSLMNDDAIIDVVELLVNERKSTICFFSLDVNLRNKALALHCLCFDDQNDAHKQLVFPAGPRKVVTENATREAMLGVMDIDIVSPTQQKGYPSRMRKAMGLPTTLTRRKSAEQPREVLQPMVVDNVAQVKGYPSRMKSYMDVSLAREPAMMPRRRANSAPSLDLEAQVVTPVVHSVNHEGRSVEALMAELNRLLDVYLQKCLSADYKYLLPPPCRPPWHSPYQTIEAMFVVYTSTLRETGIYEEQLRLLRLYCRNNVGNQESVIATLSDVVERLSRYCGRPLPTR